MNTVFIGLGSNEGDRIEKINLAIKEISTINACKILSLSSFYESTPFGNVKQNNFVNAVVKITTDKDHQSLLKNLKDIEQKLGRIKREKWGPREIDIDILFFNDLIFSNEFITLPHEGVIYRDFVLIPLCEIDAEFVHPVYNKKVCEFIEDLKIKNVIRKIDNKKSL
jgi:2-amino-4-hydroxy-6-hydroxymethyldihydropteridine diphosphokinase